MRKRGTGKTRMKNRNMKKRKRNKIISLYGLKPLCKIFKLNKVLDMRVKSKAEKEKR